MIKKLTIKKFLEQKLSTQEVWNEMRKLHEENKHLNILLQDYFEKTPTEGTIPISIKDNIHIAGQVTTSGSRIMKNFVAPFSATVVERASKFASIIGKTNLDEFAMGSTGKTSYFGPSISSWKSKQGEYMCPGGSCSGSAASVSLGICLASIGTETGGSIRTPAAWSGLVGLKPTYGVLSRYGIVPLCVDYDCPGILTKTVWDCEWVFNQLKGIDEKDGTSIEYKPLEKKGRFAVLRNMKEGPDITEKITETKELLIANGYECKEYDLDIIDYGVLAYMITCFVDASSNLSRYNGIFYGDTEDHVRDHGFGEEVKRRIVIGNYMAYENDAHQYYTKAQKVIYQINHEVQKIWAECDFILMPVTAGRGMTMKEIYNPDPIEMYKCDKYSDFSCLIGTPGLTIPVSLSSDTNTPLAIQLVGADSSENLLFSAGKVIEEHFQFHEKYY